MFTATARPTFYFRLFNLIIIFLFFFFFSIKNTYNMVLVSNLSNYGDIIYFFNSFFNFYFPYKIKNICDSYFFFKNSSSLLNSLSFYHPAMLYIYIYSSFLFIYFRNNIFFFKESKNYKNEHFIIISFILSMLWSSQEIF